MVHSEPAKTTFFDWPDGEFRLSKLEFTRGESIASKYEVVDSLDQTPLGVTYRVKHQRTGKFVRLTMLRPKIAGREQKEQILEIYKRMKDFQHPAVLKIGELGEHEGVVYFTSEDFEGQTLRELITEYRVEGKRFEVTDAAQITNQILEGLEALHEPGFFLRGLRPEYVMVNVRRTGPRNKNLVARIKIMGAGFWNLVPTAQLAEDEFSRGESQYLPPEMKGFEPEATERADIYSAGVIFYEMLTGIAPTGTFQLPATVRPDLPKFLNDIVELALAQSPEDRYHTAADFMVALQRTLREREPEAAETRSLLAPLPIGVGLVFLASISVILWSLRPDADAEKTELANQDSELRRAVRAELEQPSREQVDRLYKQSPPNMVYIPTGPYVAGRMHVDPDARADEPLAAKQGVGDFLMDRFEYPNLLNEPPMNNVSYGTAEKLCSEQGKRLCSATEWEKACKGPSSAIYAYDAESADAYDPAFCLPEQGRPAGYPSGSLAGCKSAYGVFDLSGNYREWSATAVSGRSDRRIAKGGNPLMRNPVVGTRCAASTGELADIVNDMSFRCCLDVNLAAAATPTATESSTGSPTADGDPPAAEAVQPQ